MASIYENNMSRIPNSSNSGVLSFLESIGYGYDYSKNRTAIPGVPTALYAQSLASSTPTTASSATPVDVSSEIANIKTSVAQHAKSIGELTSASADYYKKANMANKISAYTNIAQGAMNLVDTYTAGRSNVRLTNRQLDMQKDLIDLNIKNNESLLTEQFKNAVADLQTVYAAKNVDVSSQAVRSEIVGSGEDMGKDIADVQTQGKLQKLAIDFQKSMNISQQRRNERQALVNFGANIASSAMFLI